MYKTFSWESSKHTSLHTIVFSTHNVLTKMCYFAYMTESKQIILQYYILHHIQQGGAKIQRLWYLEKEISIAQGKVRKYKHTNIQVTYCIATPKSNS